MPYWLDNFNGVTIPQNLGPGTMDIAAGAAHSALVTLPGGLAFDTIGVNTQAGSISGRAVARLAANCLIVGANAAAVLAVADSWQGMIGLRQLLYRVSDTGSHQYVTARLIDAPIKRSVADLLIAPMTLVFETADLPWHDDNGSPTTTNVTMTVSGTTYTATVSSPGSAWTNRIAVSIVAGSGAVATFQWGLGGLLNTWGGLVAAGKTLAFDCAARSVKNDGVDAYSGFTPNTSADDWAIARGNSTWSFRATYSGTAPVAHVTPQIAWA